MTDKVEGLREKAFTAYADLGMGKGGCPQAYTVIRLEDAEAAIEEAERRGAEREREACALMVLACRAVPEPLNNWWFGARKKLAAAIRSRTEGGASDR